jgi:predicted transcriptional regulator
MDALFALGEASAHDVRAALDSPPSYSAVRATLRILEEKGAVKHRQEGATYVYAPRVTKRRASRSALERVVATFFDGSVEQAIAALVELPSAELSDAQRDELLEAIRGAEEQGR